MRIVDVYWTDRVNMLKIVCDCGNILTWPCNISTVNCYSCGKEELWHAVDPHPRPWDKRVMESRLC